MWDTGFSTYLSLVDTGARIEPDTRAILRGAEQRLRRCLGNLVERPKLDALNAVRARKKFSVPGVGKPKPWLR